MSEVKDKPSRCPSCRSPLKLYEEGGKPCRECVSKGKRMAEADKREIMLRRRNHLLTVRLGSHDNQR